MHERVNADLLSEIQETKLSTVINSVYGSEQVKTTIFFSHPYS